MVRRVTEVSDEAPIPIWKHPEWRERFPWLVQGTTGRAADAEASDLGLFGSVPVGESMARWRYLRETTDMGVAIHARQVHGSAILEWREELPPGLVISEDADGHMTRLGGHLLTVSIADCVPVFVVDAAHRAVALVHAGWRGVADGIVEAAVRRLTLDGAAGSDLWLHCGPSICGRCYEVGPEVHEAVRPGRGPAGKAPIDLVAAIAERVEPLGVAADRVTGSTHCTLCDSEAFYSHRGGSSGRQLGLLGVV